MSRRLSHWGWGWADEHPSAEQRRDLGKRLKSLLGFRVERPREAPSLESIRTPAPRIRPPQDADTWCSTAMAERVLHTYGRSFRDQVRALSGDFSPAPDIVARPQREDDVARILEWASAEGVAVIPYGGGTSVVGGVEPDVGDAFAATLSLDLRGLDQVLEIDPVSRAARIQAGALGPSIEAQLGAQGLTLRHYPQSFEFSTLGGWLATRSGGHFATGRTHLDDFVESMRSLAPSGVMESRRLPASGAGPSPDRLMLGSEGALGVITEAWMRVQPRPRFRSTAQVRFQAWEAAVAAACIVAQSGLWPTNCRLLDQREAMLNGVVSDGSCVLLLGFEASETPTHDRLEAALKIALATGGVCPDGAHHREDENEEGAEDAAGRWRRAFFNAPYLQSSLITLGAVVDTFETSCTWDVFPRLHAEIVRGVKEAMRSECGKGFISCRFTHVYPDGPAPYYTFIAPSKAKRQLSAWTAIKSAASDLLIENGATITHHHAVGRVHQPWYERQAPELFQESIRAVKRTLDPAGILNPGVLVR